MNFEENATPLGAIAKNVVTDEVRRARLMWRAKRGLLENDILMTRFFEAHPVLTDAQVYGLDLLLDLPDDELLGLMMSRKELKDVDPTEHMMNEDDMRCANDVLMLLRTV
jgi:antitoxin CptB